MTPLDAATLAIVCVIVAVIFWHARRADKRDREKGRLFEAKPKTRRRRKAGKR